MSADPKPLSDAELDELRACAYRDRGGDPIGPHGIRYQRLLATIDQRDAALRAVREHDSIVISTTFTAEQLMDPAHPYHAQYLRLIAEEAT